MTEKLEWKKEYEVGVQAIDKQHKKLVEIAGLLYDALAGDPQEYKRDLPKILKDLSDYTIYHFSTEERFMKDYGYPGAETHKIAHRNFIAEINNRVRRLSASSADSGILLYEYVGSWLFTHIAKSDKLLADFILRKEKAALG